MTGLKIGLTLVSAVTLVGCASTKEYEMYASGQAKIEEAKYLAQAARYKAMADIAASGDSAAKIAAVVAMAVGQGSTPAQSAQLRAPEPAGNGFLQWASVLVPALTQGYSIYANTKLGMAQSNNSARVAESTNSSFLGMATSIQTAAAAGTAGVVAVAGQNSTALQNVAGQIQAPAANVSYTLSGTGVLGNGTYSTSTEANPQYTLSGTGVMGSGSFSRTQTTNTLSGTGTQGGGAYTGPTSSSPTVVTPVVTTQPVVVTPVVTNPVVTTQPVVVTPVVVSGAASAPR